MSKTKRINPMSADDFADYCASASAKDVQAALDDGAEWDSRAFITAATSNPDSNVIWVLLRWSRKSDINLLNARSKDNRQTALHWVAGHNPNPDVTHTLIAAGADINARDAYGHTPLGQAETVQRMGWRDRREIIDMLKKAGAR